jgi:hypothetical protein
METLERANFEAAREYQAYYDEALCRHVGIQVPQPRAGQDVNDYRCETLRTFKRMFLPPAHGLYKIQYRNLRDDSISLRNLEPQLLSACVTEAYNPAHVPKGELKQINELDAYGRVSSTRFIGQESFVKQMGRPGRRVKAINTMDHGLMYFTDKKGDVLI